MKITIEVADQDVALITHWASVSRTLNLSKELILNIPLFDDDRTEMANLNLSELEDLEPVLNRLHQTVREAIWKQQNEKTLDKC